ncbi:MAG: glycerate kinase [Halanaerobiales bacterium]
MKVLIAPDSFKGSLSAVEVADYIERGLLKVCKDVKVIKLPMADGGEGTVDTILAALSGKFIEAEVTGPLGNQVIAGFGLIDKGRTAIIEMAAASGYTLIPEDQANPMKTTTYGTGELIKAALDKGVEEIILGIGGSATNDAGVGMAQALGVSFLDNADKDIGFGGGELSRIKKIDCSCLDSRIEKVNIKVACDVNNPLYGENGAAYVYGPQKGATDKMVKTLDKNLRHIAKLIKNKTGIDLQTVPGAGAAGGLGGGLKAFLDAELLSGIDIILDTYNIDDKIKGTDLVITGEGKIDKQTMNGKVPLGVARMANHYSIPVVAIAGMVVSDECSELNEYIDCIFSITQAPVDIEQAKKQTSSWIEFTTQQIINFYLLKNND